MYKDFKKGYDNFSKKFFTRLNGEEFVPSGDEVSIYSVVSTLRDKYGVYNNIFFNKLTKNINSINFSNGYSFLTAAETEKKLRRVGNIGFYVDENGYYYCKVYYVDGKGKVTGTTDVDNFIRVGASDDELNKNKSIFTHYLDNLSKFAVENPGVEFRWDKLNPQVEAKYVGDDFINVKLDLYNIDNVKASFVNPTDFFYADYNSKEHGEINDYVFFYSDEILKKSSLNVNDLDPFIKKSISKELSLGGDTLHLK